MELQSHYPKISQMSANELRELRIKLDFPEDSALHKEWALYLERASHAEDLESSIQQMNDLTKANNSLKFQRNLAITGLLLSLVSLVICGVS